MRIYAESSAVLSWLFGEPPGVESGRILALADTVISSDLTLIECRRAMHRGVLRGHITDEEAARLGGDLDVISNHWMISRINQETVALASRRFPVEPIRALDAIHLATAARMKSAFPDLAMLTLDRRVRENAAAMGFVVVP